MKWKHKHLLGIDQLSGEEIRFLLEKGNQYREWLEQSPKKLTRLSGYYLINLFFEASTRTRVSFEMAGKLLGMEVVNFTNELSSLNTVSYTHLRAHETVLDLVCRLLLETKKYNVYQGI